MSADAPTPFDDIRDLARSLPALDRNAAEAVRLRYAAGARGLGRLAALAAWVASCQAKPRPSADRALVCLFAASHEATLRREPAALERARRDLDAFTSGSASLNAVCTASGLGLKAFDLALDLPTADIAEGPALDERGCVATIAFGMEAIAGGADAVAIGALGVGTDLAAAAVLSGLWGDAPGRWIDPASDPDGAGRDTVAAALARMGGRRSDPLAALGELGGRDLAAMAGTILSARHGGIPVVLDGFSAAAAAAVVAALAPGAADHCLAGHLTAHPAHPALLDRLGLLPLLTGLGLDGPGLGGALALGLLKTALACDPRSGPAASRPLAS